MTLGILLSALGVRAQSNYSTPYYFSVLAGANSVGASDGPGGSARFNQPEGFATDGSGNIFIADTWSHTIRKISSNGSVATVAGLAGIKGSADGTGSDARFQFPSGIAVDSSGNVYVADTGNHTIRRITAAGVVTTFAGAAGQAGSADGTGADARFQKPLGLTMSIDGNLYVADDSGDDSVAYNHREAKESLVRKITPSGVVTTFATGLSRDLYDSYGVNSKPPFSVITSDASGNIIVASTGSTTQPESNTINVQQGIKRYTPAGALTGLLGIIATFSRYPGANPADGLVTGLAVDRSGNLFVAESQNNRIIKYDLTTSPDPTATVLLRNTGENGSLARLGGQLRLATDRAGNTLILDSYENTVRLLSANLAVSVVAGMPDSDAARSMDGKGGMARFKSVASLCADSSGNLYAADSLDHVIRKISPDGIATTVAGLAGTPGTDNGRGSAARFAGPMGIAVDSTGQIFVADTQNHVIRKISAAGDTTNFAGSGAYGSQDGSASSASFSFPTYLVIDAVGTLYVIDGHVIRKISAAGEVSTVVVTVSSDDKSGDSGLVLSNNFSLTGPGGLALDPSGNIFVADAAGNAIRKISPTGVMTTLAGGSAKFGYVDGKLDVARFSYPTGLAFDATGNLLVADFGNSVIRKITPAGDVSTVGGMAGIRITTEGLGDRAGFEWPGCITTNTAGNLFIGNITSVLKGVLGGPPVISTQPASQSVTEGGSAQFSVTAGGVPAPTYQWYFKNSPFSGGTGSTLSLPNVRASDAGDYTVVVTNSLGSVTSGKATLTVTSVSTPPPSSGASGGGGALTAWFAFTLVALGSGRFFIGQRRT